MLIFSSGDNLYDELYGLKSLSFNFWYKCELKIALSLPFIIGESYLVS
jgi:hypothetical protein